MTIYREKNYYYKKPVSTMRYWLSMATRENWQKIQVNNIYGVSKKHLNSLQKVAKGDEILIFVRQEIIDKKTYPSIITAIYKIDSEIFEDHNRILSPPQSSPDEDYPYRVKIKPVKIFKNPVEFKPLVPLLNFITNKKNWASHLQGHTIRKIPEEDFTFIIKQED